MGKRNDGKPSEAVVQVILKNYMSRNPCYFARLYDTTSARGSFIPQQIADFWGAFAGVPMVVEVKSSNKKEYVGLLKIPKSYISDGQVSLGRLFVRAGGQGYFVFHCIVEDTFEVWDTEDVIQWVLTSKRPSLHRRLAKAQGKKELAVELLQIFKTGATT